MLPEIETVAFDDKKTFGLMSVENFIKYNLNGGSV